jgi:hypothetical protein
MKKCRSIFFNRQTTGLHLAPECVVTYIYLAEYRLYALYRITTAKYHNSFRYSAVSHSSQRLTAVTDEAKQRNSTRTLRCAERELYAYKFSYIVTSFA